jgi:CMP-N,N'-diacetyllegionaminic acid synthase
MKTLGIIPARGGSKRLPRKNVRPLAGKPLVARIIEASLEAERLSRVVVSSEDDEVLAIAATYDPRLALRRPAEIADDHAPAISYVQHALRVLESAGEGPFDAIAIVPPSAPLTLSQDIDGTLELLERSGADSAVSVQQLDHAIHPVKLKTMQGDRLLPFWEEEAGRMAAHELPTLFVRNCAIYAARRATIDAGQIIGPDCRGYVMPADRSIDINEEIDLDFAEFLLSRSSKK